MPSLVLAARGLRGVFCAPKFGATFSSITGRGWSSCEVVREIGKPGVFDAILVASSPIGTIGNLVHDARKTLTQATKVDKLRIKKVKEEVLVGNSRGLDLANLANIAHRLDAELVAVKKEMASDKKEMASDKAKLELALSRQEERIKFLVHSNDCYKLLRGRYLSTCGRVYFGINTKGDKEIIEKGNLTAHWGDAVFDASLYIGPNGRTDAEVFHLLYGVLPEQMQRIKHDETIEILNTHAGILSSDSKKASRKFYNAFSKFIELFEMSGFDESYLDGKETEVTCAYRTFVGCLVSEVKRVRPKRRS